MKKLKRTIINALIFTLLWAPFLSAQEAQPFQWPNGNTMAISLTWDDGRSSQVTVGTPILDAHGVKATFYVLPSTVEKELEGWRNAVASGHEIGNHSLLHPCSGNFLWARENALEEYSLEQMQLELAKANESLVKLLGVTPTEFAYPCGQTFVGRGANTASYVPVVHEQFSSGRTWLDEVPNDPAFCDMAQLTGVEMDGKNFDQILELIESARGDGLWIVLGGHEIGDRKRQTTEVAMLNKLLPYITNPANKIWTAPVGEISAYIRAQRGL